MYGAADNYPSWRRTDGRCQPATSRMSVCLSGWHTGHLDSMSPRSESSHIFWRSNGCSSTEYKYSYLQRNHRGLLLPHLSNTHTHTFTQTPRVIGNCPALVGYLHLHLYYSLSLSLSSSLSLPLNSESIQDRERL